MVQFLVYVDDANMLRGSVHNIEMNTESLSVASKETGIEVNADKTKYMVMSRDQNAGRSWNIKTDSSTFERVEDKYLGTTYINQNSIQKEMKSRRRSGNAFYHSVQNF
jgi:hypothetical protein